MPLKDIIARKAYEKKRRQDPAYIIRMRKARAKWRADNPEKNKKSYTKSRQKKLIAEPWYRLFILLTSRCYAKSHHYYKNGIKCFLSAEDVKTLWFRDKAYLLERPSLDRKDSNGHYTMDNTRIIEFEENMKLAYENRKKKRKS